MLDMGIEDAARLEEEVDDPALRLAAFFGYAGMVKTGVRDKNGSIRYPRHELTGAAMVAKYMKRIGVEKEVADRVVALMRERGEKRRIEERKKKIEAHTRKQQEAHEAKLERKKMRREMMEVREEEARKRSRRKKRRKTE